MEWYLAVLKKYADFSGRARRREYWMFVLINFLIASGLTVLGMVIHPAMALYVLYLIAMFIPSLAVGFRRLHDTGRSAWWFLILLVPFIGAIVFLVWLCQDGKPGGNQWGPNPKEQAVEAAPAF